MNLLTPQSRFRLYGSPGNYFSVARDVVSSRILAGDAIADLEAQVARMLGVRHAICMPQARVGIYLALRALIRPGQKVVLSPYTIHDVINMVICAGGAPCFADIQRETTNIDAAEVEKLVDDDTGAVLITHLHGLACDIPRIEKVCRERGVPLIEDSAQAFGCRLGGKYVGTFGRAGVYSFGMAKNVNSFYGGMVVTDDDALAERIRAELRDLPPFDRSLLLKRVAFCLLGDVLTAPVVFQGATYWVFRYGYLHNIESITKRWRGEDEPKIKRELPTSYLRRMTPMQARLIAQLLKDVERNNQIRIDYARRYWQGLRDIPQIIIPPMREDGSHIYLSYPIQAPDRHKLLRFLTQQGRDLAIQHVGNNADYECYGEWRRDCPHTRATADQVLLLPTYPSYGMREVDRNVALVRRYFGVS